MSAERVTYAAGPAFAAFLALTAAVTAFDGHYSPLAALYLLISLGLTLLSVLGGLPLPLSTLSAGFWLTSVAFAVTNLGLPVGRHLNPEVAALPARGLQVLWLLLMLSWLPSLRVAPLVARLRLAALFGLALAQGAWIIHASPAPPIDVWTVQQAGSRVLLQGHNPYRPGALAIQDTGPQGGTVVAFPYLPTTLLADAAGYAATGDVRWSLLVAQLLAALALVRIGALRPETRGTGELAAALLLGHPRGALVLELAWNEPLALACLTWTSLAWLQGRRVGAALGVGMLASLKQYLPIFWLFFGLLSGFGPRLLALAGAVVALSLAPFLLAGPGDLLQATILFYLNYPLRYDALSLPVTFSMPGLARLGPLAPLGVWLACWRRRLPLARVLYGGGFALLGFFALGRQAFANYYYLVGAVLLLGALVELVEPGWSEAPWLARRLGNRVRELPSGLEPAWEPALPPGQLPGRVLWAVLAYVVVACALTINNGHLNEGALVLLLVALGMALAAVRGGPPVELAPAGVIIAGLALACVLIGSIKPVANQVRAGVSMLPIHLGQAALLGLVGCYLAEFLGAGPPRWLARIRWPGLLLLTTLMGIWTCWASPEPSIDVFKIYQEGARLILQGYSPYIGDAIDVGDTGPRGGIVNAYGYPPMTLYLFTGAYAVTGDSRHAVLLSYLGSALLLSMLVARARERDPRLGLLGELLGVLLLVHPRSLFVLEMGWNEALALPLLGLAIYWWRRQRMLGAALALGATCAVKQHLLLFLPFFALLPGFTARWLGVAVAAWFLTLVPFLRAPGDLYQDLVVYHLQNPFRNDALSLPAWLTRWQATLPGWVGLGSPLAAWILALRHRCPGAVLNACALAFFLFFVLGRQAFCNYYHMLGAIWLYAAAVDLGAEVSGPSAPSSDLPECGPPTVPEPSSEDQRPD